MLVTEFGLLCSADLLTPLMHFMRIQCKFDVRALWTPNMELSVQVATEYDIPFVAVKPDEVLLRRDVQTVLIFGCPYLHAQITIKTLGIGKHIMCGAPPALCQSDVQKMVQAAHYYPQLMSTVGYCLHTLDVFQEMQQRIRNGELGQLRTCDVFVRTGALHGDSYCWSCESRMGGGALSLIGSHLVDLLFFLFGKRVKHVQSLVRNFVVQTAEIKSIRKITADDYCTLLLRMDDDACATVSINCHTSNQFEFDMLVCGSEGRLRIKNGDLFGQCSSTSSDEQLLLRSKDLPSATKPVWVRAPSMPAPMFWQGTFHVLLSLLNDVLPRYNTAAQVNNQTVERASKMSTSSRLATFEDAQYVLAVIEAARQSSQYGGWIPVR